MNTGFRVFFAVLGAYSGYRLGYWLPRGDVLQSLIYILFIALSIGAAVEGSEKCQ